MKSLEHLIREIQEGKTEKTEKKSLEGSIRNIMSKESSYAAKDSKPVDEHCGCEDEKKKKKVSKEDGDKLPGAEDKMDEAIGTLGTDKYQGTEFKSIRTATPHIQPPKGDETHSQAPENASRLRSIAKEKQGINRVTEGKVDLAIKGVSKIADIMTDIAKPYVASKSKQLVPYVSKEVQAVKSAETAAAKAATEKLPVPAKAPETKLPAPVVPPKIETKTDVKPQAATPTATKTDVDVKPQAATPTATKSVAAPAPTTSPKPVVAPETKTAPAVPSKLADVAKKALPIIGALPGLLSKSTDSVDVPGKPHIQAPWRVEKHYRHRHFKESTEQRKQIEDMPRKDAGESPAYVGRPSDDPKTAAEKTSRQAQYKIKVIDESKKLASIIKKTTKEYESGDKPKVFDRGEDVIVINPDLNKNSLDTKQ
jgi:hypothetical protein